MLQVVKLFVVFLSGLLWGLLLKEEQLETCRQELQGLSGEYRGQLIRAGTCEIHLQECRVFGPCGSLPEGYEYPP